MCSVTWKIPELIEEHLKGDIRQVGVFFLNLSLHCLKRIKTIKKCGIKISDTALTCGSSATFLSVPVLTSSVVYY